MIYFCSNHALGLSSEEKNHSLYIKIGVTSVCKDTIFFGYMTCLQMFFAVQDICFEIDFYYKVVSTHFVLLLT
ncbi:hypothetical protein HMPREF0973_01125 [Prevotella veroralis F0319]|uniref:Uncharacterized protein n=1 Tax=Prevotella veroralis F0319 TaxID=649761 RepID=C9MND7_9BACT|nr:hypothetical protein HMPREF0973_01125 [Prevotella veroralis F0319]